MNKLKCLDDNGIVINEGSYSSFNYEYEKYQIRTREYNIYESEEYLFINTSYFIDIHIYHYRNKDVYGIHFIDLTNNTNDLIYRTKHHYRNSIILADDPNIPNEIEINKKNLYIRITRLSRNVCINIKYSNELIFYSDVLYSSIFNKQSINKSIDGNKHMFELSYIEEYKNANYKYKNMNSTSYMIYEFKRSYYPKNYKVSSTYKYDNIDIINDQIQNQIKYELEKNVITINYKIKNDRILLTKDIEFRR